MTDPFADLERELLAAHARNRRPRLSLRPVRVLAVAAGTAAAVAAAVFVGAQSDPERAVAPQPQPAQEGGGAAAVPADCDGPGERFQPEVSSAPPPAAIADLLAVLREPQPRADVERHFAGGQAHRVYGDWRALGEAGGRTVAVLAADIVPRAQVKSPRGECRPPEGTIEPGVCLHLGMPDAMGATVACFTPAEITDGRAYIDGGGGIIGLAPDAAAVAEAGGEESAVRDNVFRLPGGPETRVRFRERGSGEGAGGGG